ncbi:MAG: hemerythrin domain-containing protein [Ferruginibacter sp.]|nr:hemerythrin domain-containing protein [Ferruginibacter sp.]
MKRHPSLAHLSRKHHGALILARLLQENAPAYNGLPADTAGKAVYALKFYNDELIKHFEEEEKVLYLVTGINGPIDLLIQMIFREHQELHAAFKLVINHTDLSVHLDELGKALEIHIRKEERQLFPLIELSCGEKLLAAIAASLSSH